MPVPTATTLWRLLRSRRLAVGLIAAVVGYSVLATLVAQGAQDSERVTSWAAAHPFAEKIVAALGLHSAFTSPFFLVMALMLTFATAACAVERTQRAIRYTRAAAPMTSGTAQRLRERPNVLIAVERPLDDEEIVTSVSAALSQRHFAVRQGPRLVEGTRGRWGAWGSPIFHWALVALFIVLGAGQLTRAEGVVGLFLGEPVRDAPLSYLELDQGPLFGNRFTGIDIVADDVIHNYRIDGVDRGSVPSISLLRNGQVLASQRVYANNPVRYGSILMHMTETGLSPVFSVEETSGRQLNRLPFRLRYPSDESSTTLPGEFSLLDETGRGVLDLRITMPLTVGPDGAVRLSVPTAPVSLIQTAPAGTDRYGEVVALTLGRSMELPDGRWLRFVSADDWVLVTVANDWSVPYIYLMFALIGIGLSVSVLVPPRRVLVGVVRDGDSVAVHVLARHERRDPAFASTIAGVIAAALEEDTGTSCHIDEPSDHCPAETHTNEE